MDTIYLGQVNGTPLGTLWLALSEEGLLALDWSASQSNLLARLRRRVGTAILRDDAARTATAARQLGVASISMVSVAISTCR